MTLSAYVDDSGSDPSAPLYVLGGVCLPEGWWEQVSSCWRGALQAAPKVEYFKASEVWEQNASKGTPFVHLTTRERKWKVDCLVEVLIDFDPMVMSFELEWQVFKEFKAQVELPEGLDDPYFFLYYGVILLMAKWEARENHWTPVDFVFDQQGVVGDRVRKWYPIFKTRCAPDIQARLGQDPRFDDEKKVIPLQAADLVAWYARRNALGQLPGEWHHGVWKRLSRYCSQGTIDGDNLMAIWGLVSDNESGEIA